MDEKGQSQGSNEVTLSDLLTQVRTELDPEKLRKLLAEINDRFERGERLTDKTAD